MWWQVFINNTFIPRCTCVYVVNVGIFSLVAVKISGQVNINMPLKTIKMRKQQEDRACFLSRTARYTQTEPQQKEKERKIRTATLARPCSHTASESPGRASLYSDFQEKKRVSETIEAGGIFLPAGTAQQRAGSTKLFKEPWISTSNFFVIPLPVCEEAGGPFT